MTDFIEVYDNALPASLCTEIIEAFEASPYKQPGRTGNGIEPSKKDSEDLYFQQHAEYQSIVTRVQQITRKFASDYFKKYHFALIAPLALKVKDPQTGQPIDLTHENYEQYGKGNEDAYMQFLYRLGPIQAQKYLAQQGNYNYWHCETYPQAGSHEALHRTLLFMYYLNDVHEGGQTDFYYQNKSITPKQGRMVIAPAYFTHTHRGNTPVSHDKYIITSWILHQPGEQLFAYKTS